MGLETFLLEVFGLACPALLTFAATQHFAFVPLFPKEPKFNNDLYVSCIPAAVYLVFRLYFAFIMAGSTKVPSSYRSYLTGFLVVMSMIAPFFHTQLQLQLWSLYEATAGPLVKVIYDASEADVLRSIEFGKKVFLLLAAWWVLFFVLELVLRVVFMVIRGVYSAIQSTFRRSSLTKTT